MAEWKGCELDGSQEWQREHSPEQETVTAKEYADIAKEMAGLAELYADRAGAHAEDAGAAADSAEERVNRAKDEALAYIAQTGEQERSEIAGAGDDARTAIAEARQRAVEEISDKRGDAQAAIEHEGREALRSIMATAADQVSAIDSAAASAAALVHEAGETELAAIQSAHTDISAAVEQATTAASGAVNAATTAQNALANASAMLDLIENEAPALVESVEAAATAAVTSITNAERSAEGSISEAVAAGRTELKGYADDRVAEIVAAGGDVADSVARADAAAKRAEHAAESIDADAIRAVVAEETERATAAEGAISDALSQLSNTVEEHGENIEIQTHRIDVLAGTASRDNLTYADIDMLVKHGLNASYFKSGDQIVTTWNTYSNPYDILEPSRQFETEDGIQFNGLPMQAHYASQYAPTFDPQEAMYDADEEIPAGTYNFKVTGNTWLSSENNKYFQFTLSKPVPVGGQIVLGNQDAYNQALSGQTIKIFPSADSMTAIETVTLSEGQGGTYLGQTDGKDKVNHFQAMYRGSGRWSTSMVRQWLNTDKPKGEWWQKQSRWDRIGAFANSTDGYMRGLSEDFKKVLKRVKVETARNTVNLDGGTDVTYDYFWLLSLEQLNGTPQIEGPEGKPFDYWLKQAASETVELDARGRYKNHPSLYPTLIKYGINANTSARSCWLRSALRGTSYVAWYVYSTGYVGNTYALNGYYVAPACVI